MQELALNSQIMPTIPLEPSIRLRRASPEEVAIEACEASDAFHLVFIHADTGGRALEAGMHHRGPAYCEAMRERCDWQEDRCIVIAPRHETEAWILADPSAVMDTLGYRGTPGSLGLPIDGAQAERLVDPKKVLQDAVSTVRGRRRPVATSQIGPAIAQRQRFASLRRGTSFRNFETQLRAALNTLGI